MRKNWKSYGLIGAAAALFAYGAHCLYSKQTVANDYPSDYTETSSLYKLNVRTVAEGLEHPWGMAFLPEGAILVTERAGRLRMIDPQGKLLKKPISGVPEVYAAGQGGLLDVALDPAFETNGLVYLSYAAKGAANTAGTEVVRGWLDGMALKEVEVIFKVEPKTPGTNHYGSRLLFGRDGNLYITVGDRFNFMHEAQNTENHLGSIMRIKPDGSIPEDNPFVGSFAGREDAKPEIYAYGIRNAQGMALRPYDDQIWYHEHGPQGGDEVNILKKGGNYGWPKVTHGIDYSGAIISEKTQMEGMEQPVLHWTPSIAPSGMEFYTGDKFPEWEGDLFVGALTGQHLRRLRLEGDKIVGQETLLEKMGERIRDVEQGPDGYLYVLTDAPNGKVLRLEPAE